MVHHRGDGVPVFGQGDRRLQQFPQAEGAETFRGGLPGVDGPGHRHRQQAPLRHGVQAPPPVFLNACLGRSRAAAVEAVQPAGGGLVIEEETIAPDARGKRFADAQHRAGRDGRVHGVAAGFEYVQPGLAGRGLAGGHHALGGHHHGTSGKMNITHEKPSIGLPGWAVFVGEDAWRTKCIPRQTKSAPHCIPREAECKRGGVRRILSRASMPMGLDRVRAFVSGFPHPQ